MADKSKIEWTDATVNFWWGCTKVGPGCDNCYAETWDKRTGGAHFGQAQPRRWIKSAVATLENLNQTRPGSWVFIQSMSDLFDNEVPLPWFETAWAAICAATELRVQIVTKRLPMVEKRLAQIGATFWPEHVGLIATVCNQVEADRDVPRLLKLKAERRVPWVGLSMEPLLGPVDLTLEGLACLPCPNAADGLNMDPTTGAYECCSRCDHTGIGDEWGLDWVIVGGESGPHARPMHPDWARSLRDQCVAAGVAFHFKQWGEWGSGSVNISTGEPVFRAFPDFQTWVNKASTWINGGICLDAKGRQCRTGADMMRARDEGAFPVTIMHRVGKKAAGRTLDGRTWDQMPGVVDG